MPVQVINSNQLKNESALDKVLKAVEVAKAGFGIYTNMEQLNAAKQAEADRKEAENNKLKYISPDKKLEYAKDYSFSDAPSTGSVSFTEKNPAGDKTLYANPIAKAKAPTNVTQEQFSKLVGDGFREAPEGTPGSILISRDGPNGTPVQSVLIPPPMKVDPEKQPKPDQFKVAGFARRLEQAEQVFNDLQGAGYDRTSKEASLSSMLPGSIQDSNIKSQQQAERNFVNALLRRESGSAISDKEFQSAEQQYFPRSGDTPEIVKQKEENRQLAFQGFKNEAGPAFDRLSLPPHSNPARPTGNSSSLIPDANAAQQKKTAPDAEDIQAMKWLKSNPNDPHAGDVAAKLKRKGL